MLQVCGFNQYHQLFKESNAQNYQNNPIVFPPMNAELDLSSIQSYSVCLGSSVTVDKNGKAFAIGDNRNCQIIGSLPKGAIDKWTQINISYQNISYKFISALCNGYFTLYLISPPDNDNILAALVCSGKNDGNPYFLKHNSQKLVSLFGGNDKAAIIDSEGSIYIINQSVIRSPDKTLKPSRLPNKEKAIYVIFLKAKIYALSINGKVYEHNIDLKNSDDITFSEVKELSDYKIIQISGYINHCFAVSNFNQVFCFGLNKKGELGIGANKEKVNKFTEIEFFNDKNIVAAYAGYYYSLFQDKNGKVYASGSNGFGELQIEKGHGNYSEFLPIETTVKEGATFCITNTWFSAIFINIKPPPRSPNLATGPVDLSDPKKDLEELKLILEQTKLKNDKLQEEIELLQSKNDMAQQIKNLEDLLTNLKNDNTEKAKEIGRLKNIESKKIEEIAELKKQIEPINNQLKERNDENEFHKAEIKSLNEKIQSQIKDIEFQKSEYLKLTKEKGAQDEKVGELEDKLNDRVNEIENLKKSLEDAKIKDTEKMKEIDKVNEEKEKIEKSLDDAKKENDDNKNEINNIKIEIDEVKKNKEEIKQSLEDDKKEYNESITEIDNIKTIINNMKEEKENIKQLLEDTRKENDKKAAEINNIKAENEKLNIQSAFFKEQFQIQAKSIIKKSEENGHLNLKLQNYSDEINRLTIENKSLSEKVQEQNNIIEKNSSNSDDFQLLRMEYEQKIGTLNSQIFEINEQLNNKLKLSQEEIESLKKQLTSKEDKLMKKIYKVEELKKNEKKNSQKIFDLKNQVQSQAIEIDANLEEIEKLNQEIKSLKSTDIQNLLQSQKVEIENIKKELQNKEKEISDKNEEIKKLNGLQKIDGSHSSSEESHQDKNINQIIEILKEQLQNQKNALDEKTNEINELKLKEIEYKNHIKTIEEQLQKQTNELQQKEKEYNKKIEDLKNELSSQKSGINSKDSILISQKTPFDGFRTQQYNNKRKNEIDKLFKDQVKYIQEIQSLKETIQELKDSQKAVENRTIEVFDKDGYKKLKTLKKLGRGATSEVYQVSREKYFALKVFDQSVFMTEDSQTNENDDDEDDDDDDGNEDNEAMIDLEKMKSFLSEYELLNSINHPNIIKVYGIYFGDKFSEPSILLEYCPYSLKSCIRKLKNNERVKIIIQISEAMKHVHSIKIIHHDLKPENILLDSNKNVKITDFGLAYRIDSESNSAIKFGGTLQFIAPEIIQQKTNINEKIDVYSFGVVYYMILMKGELPRITLPEIFAGKKAEIPVEITKFSGELIDRCWSMDPDDRPSFDEIYKLLNKNKSEII